MENFLNNIKYYKIFTINYNILKKSSFDNKPIKILNGININYDEFIENIKKYNVECSENNNTANTNVKINYEEWLNNKEKNNLYVFHNVKNDIEFSKILIKEIPLPKFLEYNSIQDLRISRFYSGIKYSGCNIHFHSPTLNYLFTGRKLWLTFPKIENNYIFLKINNMLYDNIKEKTINWLLNNYELLIKNIINIEIFIQEKNEIIYIPNDYFHCVINLDFVSGITYSWNL